MPISLPNLFRTAIVLLMAVHVFFMYGIARTFGETVGLRPGVVLLAMLFATIMMIPLVWAVGLPDLPEAYARFRAAGRYTEGRCPRCNYDLSGLDSLHCPECGPVTPPEEHRFSVGTLQRFGIMIALAWLLGVVSAEIWTTLDERAFAREVRDRIEGGRDLPYRRPRRWPAGDVWFIYEPGEGMASRRTN